MLLVRESQKGDRNMGARMLVIGEENQKGETYGSQNACYW